MVKGLLLGTGLCNIGKHTAGELGSFVGKFVKQRRFLGRQSGDFDNGALGGKVGHRDRDALKCGLGDHAQALPLCFGVDLSLGIGLIDGPCQIVRGNKAGIRAQDDQRQQGNDGFCHFRGYNIPEIRLPPRPEHHISGLGA
jgi:hypothetical protein